MMYMASLAALLDDLSSFMPNRFTMMSVIMSLSIKASDKARIRKIPVKSSAMNPTRVPAFILRPGTTRSLIVGGTIVLIIQKITAITKLIVNRGNLRRTSSPICFVLNGLPRETKLLYAFYTPLNIKTMDLI
jgi:hypothetical protein